MPGRVTEISEQQDVYDLQKELARLRRALAAAQLPTWAHDIFTAPATYQLTYIPYGINVLADNGTALSEGTDYTVDYTTGLITFTVARTSGHVIYVSYVTTGDLTALSGPLDVGAVTDNFNRANSATTLNPASDGGTWAVDFGGVFGITSNTAYNVSAVAGVGPVSGPNVAIARRDVGQAAMEVIVDVTRSSTAGGSVIVASYDAVATSCYELFYDSSNSVGSLSRIASDGHPGLGASLAFTAWTGGTTSLKLRRDSSGVVTAYQLIAGSWVSKGSITDSFPLPGTWAGFGTAPTSAGADHWDNFNATPI